MGLFQKATKKESKLKLAIIGPGGSGKTWTALELATLLGKRVAVMDTEHRSASKYADRFEFDSCEPTSFEPEKYIRVMQEAEAEGYDVIIIDSLSHAWAGKGGLLEQSDQFGGRFDAWKKLTPKHNALIEAILACKCHVIATMRSKTEYVVEKNEKGKSEPRKVGTAPIQREGMEYEFDVMLNISLDNNITVEKTRCEQLHGRMFYRANKEIAGELTKWLAGERVVEATPAPVETTPPPEERATREQIDSIVRKLSDLIPALDDSPEARGVAMAKWRAYPAWACGRAGATSKDLTEPEAAQIIARLNNGELPEVGQ